MPKGRKDTLCTRNSCKITATELWLWPTADFTIAALHAWKTLPTDLKTTAQQRYF